MYSGSQGRMSQNILRAPKGARHTAVKWCLHSQAGNSCRQIPPAIMTYGEESGGSSTLPGGNIVAPARRRRCAHPRPSRQWAEMEREALARLILDQLPRFRSRLYLADAEALAQLLRRSPMAEVMSGDYAWSLCFEPAFVASLCWEGFLPICSELPRFGNRQQPGEELLDTYGSVVKALAKSALGRDDMAEEIGRSLICISINILICWGYW